MSADTTRPVPAGGRDYAVSHLWQKTPIHLVSFRVDLDRKAPGVSGASRSSPHSLVQELLNRSDEHLWGIVSNGLVLRLLRDNASLSRQAYVEFDLAAMMEGELYSDFTLLWLLAHVSRVEREKPETPESCRLEAWTKAAREEGLRALDTLRDGVEEALGVLGRGLFDEPANSPLRDRLASGALPVQDYYRQLLRLVYRLLFLLVAEDRGLLFHPSSTPLARERYLRYFSLSRLRSLAASRRGSRHGDLWAGLVLVMKKLGSDDGCAELALPALGGFLFGDEAMPDLVAASLGNAALLEAVRKVALTERDGYLRPVDFRNLGAEELGSVYESLLELHPVLHAEGRGSFELRSAAGSERKTTGSYYTPTSLIECLLDSALDPVLDEAAKAPDPEKALLALKVCDPACGSGHFLIAAAHRIARRLASARTGEEEPDPSATRTALRDVIGRCLYGVDLNPMAAELCRVALWIEALEPGKPLSFLDHHVQVGNSLLGTTPALLANGIPDEAFTPIEGDEKAACSAWKKQNKRERQQKGLAEAAAEPWEAVRHLADERAGLDATPDADPGGVRAKEERWKRLLASDDYARSRLLADAWCAAFVWKKTSDRNAPPPVTEETFRRLAANPASVPEPVRREVARLSDRYRFFHWHLAFPEVFRVPGPGEKAENEQQGWTGGFDVVLGNPPWERVKLQEQEFFAQRSPGIAAAPNAAARGKLIRDLEKADPSLHVAFLEARREAEGSSQLLRLSGRFPLCGRGDVNTFAVFAELNRSLVGPRGRAGFIVPTGIATDDTTKHFFQDIVQSRALVSLYDFQSGPGLFGEIGHARFKFCLLTLGGTGNASPDEPEFAFFLRSTEELADPERRFRLSPEDVRLLNPNTGTCPVFRIRRDAEITKGIYRRVPVLIDESKGEEGNPWGISFQAMLHMSNDSGLFRTREQLEAESWELAGNVFTRGPDRYLPLYEAKMVHHFDHRFGDYAMKPEGSESTALPEVPLEKLQDPSYAPLPRYWVPEAEVEARLAGRWDRGWLLGWRDICRSTDERTVIASVVPRVGVGDKFLLMMPVSPIHGATILGILCSYPFDYVARQKVGGTSLKYFTMRQLALLPPTAISGATPWAPRETLGEWIGRRVLELTFTANDMAPFARDLGHAGPPFRWDPERRFLLRCELDAAFLHLYGIPRDDVAYILDTFPIVRRTDEKNFGDYRTKLVILEIYHDLQRAIATGRPYVSRLDPPPGDSRVAHSLSEGADLWLAAGRGDAAR
ncbi:MAG: SAM-dependent DNA methyltransferase [Acidobacteria bacterium]|nr:MAG: SAM-dependent DNA methyltransferase [Acidobacteriota bacterium]MCE7956411.1 SAM-dependent DNA methyltransferase [Acidobacteria bacterium ACB2]